MFLDCVLDSDLSPVFNGNRDELLKWIEETNTKYSETLRVCVGRTMQIVSVFDYVTENY